MGCDIHCYAETRKNGRWTADSAEDCTNEGDDEKESWYMPSDFGDKNYALFGLLVRGVRREWPWSFTERGMPDDVSSEVKKISDQWDIDGHSHSWLTLDELRHKRLELLLQPEQEASALCGYLGDLINTLWPKEAKGDEHRIVFFFDN